jgi:Zn-dependent peptidase ImmA (M78 family)
MNQRWFEIVDALKDAGGNGAAEAALAIDESPLVVIGSCHAALLFSSLSPTVTTEDVRTLASVLVEQYTRVAVFPELDDLAREVPLDRTIPAWEHGYELAEVVHDELSIDDSEFWVDIDGLLRTFGITVLNRKLEDDNIRACSIVGPNHVPTVILNESSSFYGSPNAQRFTLAHELCHLLFDRSHGKKVALASGPWAPKDLERRANAFAAMFLMPATIVERVVADGPDPINDLAGVTTFASRLRVSRRAAIDHLYNLTIMSDSVRDKLLREVGD